MYFSGAPYSSACLSLAFRASHLRISQLLRTQPNMPLASRAQPLLFLSSGSCLQASHLFADCLVSGSSCAVCLVGGFTSRGAGTLHTLCPSPGRTSERTRFGTRFSIFSSLRFETGVEQPGLTASNMRRASSFHPPNQLRICQPFQATLCHKLQHQPFRTTCLLVEADAPP